MRVKAVVVRIVKQFLYDKRTIGLIMLAPILVLALTNLILAEDSYIPRIAVIEIPPHFESFLRQEEAIVHTFADRYLALDALHREELDALVEFEGTTPKITLEGSNPSANRATLQLVASLGQDRPDPLEMLEVHYLYGDKDMTLFDQVGAVLIGFLVFFFVFITAGVSFLRERSSGTLERLMGTPIRRWELVLGYIVGFGIVTSLQSVLVSLFAVKVLNVMITGPLWLLIVVTQLLAISALTLGILMSSFAQNEFQIVQLIPVVIIPQLLFSGLFNLDKLPGWLGLLGKIMPVNYGSHALRQIMLRGNSWPETALDVGALLTLSLLFAVCNVIALKKYRST